MATHDYYRILGVAPDSEDVVIQAAYRALMRRYHPDTNKSADAGRRATEINEAYAVLSDPVRKAHYDQERTAKAQTNAGPRTPPPPPPPSQESDAGTTPPRRRPWDDHGTRIAVGLIAAFVIVVAVGAINESGSSSIVDNNMAVENLEAANLIVENDLASTPTPPPVPMLANISQAPVQFDDIESAADKFVQILTKSGMSGVRSTSEKCHAGVASQPTWQSADWCAAFDYAAAHVDAEVSRAGGWTATPYFQFQSENQADRYEEAGAPAYSTNARLTSIKQAAEAAAEDAVREQIAKSKASESENAQDTSATSTDDNTTYGTNSSSASPSFDCTKAHTDSEKLVCSDSVLAALDRNMAAQYARALKVGTRQQQSLLRRTAVRFLGFRDRCAGAPCISQTYYNRMREIEDIKEGRWRG